MGGTCMLPWYCGHLAAPLSSLVEAEWIWDSEEVINLHIGDMSAEWGEKNPNKLTHKGGTFKHSQERKKTSQWDLTYVQFVSPRCILNLFNTSQHYVAPFKESLRLRFPWLWTVFLTKTCLHWQWKEIHLWGHALLQYNELHKLWLIHPFLLSLCLQLFQVFFIS